MIEHASWLEPIDRTQRRCTITAVGALALSALGAWLSPGRFFQAYLIGFSFWVGIALGCMGLVMLHHLVGGLWGYLIRRPLEAGALTIWFLALLFIPLALGLRYLYPWMRPEALSGGAEWAHKAAYLNEPFFLARAGGYFVVWLVLALLLNRWSSAQDRSADPALTDRLQLISGPGLALLFLTASFAAIDWMLSLEPESASTIYGAMVVTGQALATLALASILSAWLAQFTPLAELAAPAQFHDLGNLLLAFVMLWAYMAFSQFLIIWCGNLTEEIPWYLHRTRGGWQFVAIVLIVFHFFLPFFALLFRDVKRRERSLVVVAALVLVMHWVDLVWLVAPAPVFGHHGISVHWLDVIVPVGLGAAWMAVFLGHVKAKPLVPQADPRLAEALAHAREV